MQATIIVEYEDPKDFSDLIQRLVDWEDNSLAGVEWELEE